jgi:hypothetical protein
MHDDDDDNCMIDDEKHSVSALTNEVPAHSDTVLKHVAAAPIYRAGYVV